MHEVEIGSAVKHFGVLVSIKGDGPQYVLRCIEPGSCHNGSFALLTISGTETARSFSIKGGNRHFTIAGGGSLLKLLDHLLNEYWNPQRPT